MKKRSRTNIQNKSGLDWGSSIVCKAKSPSKKKRNTFMKFLSSDNVFWSYLTCILLLYTYFMSRCYLHLSLSVSFKLCIYIFSMFYLSVSGCVSHFLKQLSLLYNLIQEFEINFCACSQPALGLLVVYNDENHWKFFHLETKLALVSFYTPWTHQQNPTFSEIFRGYK